MMYKKINFHHLFINIISVLLTILVIVVWWNKGYMSMQALAGYLIVIIYAFYYNINQSYVIMESGSLIILKGNVFYKKKENRYKLSEIKSINYVRQNHEYYLEIEIMDVIYREKISLLGKNEISQLFNDLRNFGVEVRCT